MASVFSHWPFQVFDVGQRKASKPQDFGEAWKITLERVGGLASWFKEKDQTCTSEAREYCGTSKALISGDRTYQNLLRGVAQQPSLPYQNTQKKAVHSWFGPNKIWHKIEQTKSDMI